MCEFLVMLDQDSLNRILIEHHQEFIQQKLA